MSNGMKYGYRIVGSCREPRKLVDADIAFLAYADCDDRAQFECEGYLSAFRYGDEFADRDDRWQVDVRGFDGLCWSPWLWFDIDRENEFECATDDTRRLCAELAGRYGLDGDELLIFFSGSKGYHIGLASSLWMPEPSTKFNRVAKRLALHLADNIAIDAGIYDKVRAFRAPNSRHPKTGLHKRRITYDELLKTDAAEIIRRAAVPLPFALPDMPDANPMAVNDWQQAEADDRQHTEAVTQRQTQVSEATLNMLTRELIEDGSSVEFGDRHRRLFSAAANFAEFGCPSPLAHALLTEPGLDMGLPLSEVQRQINCGLDHGVKQ